MGPFRVTAKLLPNILAGTRKLVVMMSSDLGSIANNAQGTSHAYRSSKAALNMITKGLSTDLKDQGVTVISLAPGWTRTTLGGSGGDWETDASVSAQRRVLASITAGHRRVPGAGAGRGSRGPGQFEPGRPSIDGIAAGGTCHRERRVADQPRRDPPRA
jgi:NAD(P)-dependent dehydrogenase (short-subunit alcohol dehydrogenase family)